MQCFLSASFVAFAKAVHASKPYYKTRLDGAFGSTTMCCLGFSGSSLVIENANSDCGFLWVFIGSCW